MKSRSLEFEPGYMDPGKMSLELGYHGSSQNDLKGSFLFWREGCRGHHVWRGDIYLISHLNRRESIVPVSATNVICGIPGFHNVFWRG
jgi:hypothetical protein